MTPGYLLDTNTISAPVSRDPNTRILGKLSRHESECVIAAPVWHELTYGCRRLPKGKRRAALETYLHEVVERTFDILPYDQAAARWHGIERARLESLGRTAPFVDGQIAAIARMNNLVVVTINIRHFTRFEGLQIEDWSRPHRKKGSSR